MMQCGNLGCVKHLVGKNVDLGKDVEAWTLHDLAREIEDANILELLWEVKCKGKKKQRSRRGSLQPT